MHVDSLEEGRRVDARLKAMDAPSSSTRDFILTLLHDRVKQVQSFAERCREGLSMVQRTLFPLNPASSTLSGLLDWYRHPREVRQYVHEQLINGAVVALAFVRIHCSRLDIAKICRGLPFVMARILVPICSITMMLCGDQPKMSSGNWSGRNIKYFEPVARFRRLEKFPAMIVNNLVKNLVLQCVKIVVFVCNCFEFLFFFECLTLSLA